MVVASLKSPVQAQIVFADLLDSLIFDVASEAHRAARLGFDYRLENDEEDEAAQTSASAAAGDADAATAAAPETSGKYTVDVFGLTHPTIAQDMFDCMNCGRPIVAGRFAPHLEKCMGKGRKARLKPNSSVGGGGIQPRRGRAAAAPASAGNAHTAAAASQSRSSSRPPPRVVPPAPQDPQRGVAEANGTTTAGGSPEADKDLLPGPPHPGKARTKKSVSKAQRANPGGSATPIPFGGVVGRGGSVPDTALGSLSGLVSGMAVPVAVEPEAATVAAANHKPPPSAGSGAVWTGAAVKGRKANEKKRNIGQVLAGAKAEADARRPPVEVRVDSADATAALMLPLRDPAWA